MADARARRRGHGEDAIYFDAAKNRYVGAISLGFASPAGFEHFALELGEQARDDTPAAGLAVPPPEVLGPVAERYGIEVVGPPPRAH